ncbi:MAG: hypothetical protein D3905_09745 [Candidatus Electrothrix sp. AS4_5]|nr:hypothetical protein [Candidatus Electrothrix gigas]MCI5190058.1 hypothetical protein [Candidatus Electrothrix gigas]
MDVFEDIDVSSPNVRVDSVNKKTHIRKFGELRHDKKLKNTSYPGFWRGYIKSIFLNDLLGVFKVVS